jgi:hypothetical protein
MYAIRMLYTYKINECKNFIKIQKKLILIQYMSFIIKNYYNSKKKKPSHNFDLKLCAYKIYTKNKLIKYFFLNINIYYTDKSVFI